MLHRSSFPVGRYAVSVLVDAGKPGELIANITVEPELPRHGLNTADLKAWRAGIDDALAKAVKAAGGSVRWDRAFSETAK